MSYAILDSLRTPEDVKKLSLPDLYQLSEDLRNRVNEVVRETGGHLGPNLGAVEIILACHVVFDLKTDRLVFDVGHQSYPHKLLTGRNPNFHSLRQKDGVSGYPHPEESPYDVYRSGHASTAISTSLGILEGFLSQPATHDRKVVALVGDGSLTGGMAFEGLNHAGHLGKNLIVILNDNSMSISPTVGALSKSLNRFRHHNFVKKMEQDVVNFVQRIPRIGKRLFEALRIVGR
ncbi:MAG: 1-deoxy-D-xylulose-5-phosphate synthase, partial [Spirochaetia bacterium]|nr:1-deoxy-D-xylulose-5-phosphate synthase [Spirochaetia bacterium]